MKNKILKDIKQKYSEKLKEGYSFNILEYAKIISVEKNGSILFTSNSKDEYNAIMAEVLDLVSSGLTLEESLCKYWLDNK